MKDDKSKEQLEKEIADLQSRLLTLEKEKKVLEDLSIRDKLTGVYNRRPLEDLIQKQIARYKRFEENFAILLIDGDDFKQINDSYGHTVGDDYLKILTSLIQNNLRETDWVLRYGGEEFIVLLQDTGKEEAIILGERINTIISNHAKFPTNHAAEYRKWTVSIGISLIQKNDTVESLLERADKSLYFSKKSGKNCASLSYVNEFGDLSFKKVSSKNDIIWQ